MVALVLSTQNDVIFVNFDVPMVVSDYNMPIFLAFHVVKFQQFASSYDLVKYNHNFRLLVLPFYHAIHKLFLLQIIDDYRKFSLIFDKIQCVNLAKFLVLYIFFHKLLCLLDKHFAVNLFDHLLDVVNYSLKYRRCTINNVYLV